MNISIDCNTASLISAMKDVSQRQLPFALAKAITATAEDIRLAQQREIADVFDRPTRYTLNSVFKTSATKSKLEADVWIKDERATAKGTPASKYLAPQVSGGGRRLKRFEVALRSVGVLPSDCVVVPGSAAKIDAYGNVSRGQIMQILSYFKAFPEAGHRANMRDGGKRLARDNQRTGARGFMYFVGRPGRGSPLGIWQRFRTGFGSAIKPVLIFVSRAYYQPRYDFEFVSRSTFNKRFLTHFHAAMDYAMRTAK